MDWTQMLKDFDTSEELLRAGLGPLTADQPTAKVPHERNFPGLDSIGEVLTAINFREACHAGQTGILRQVFGREGMIG